MSGFEQLLIGAETAAATAVFSEPITLYVHRARDITMRVRQKFAFNSAEKRMSVVAECLPSLQAGSGVSSSREVQQQPNVWVFTKGAPEVLEALFAEVPSFYRATYMYHMSRGKRVLALAAKKMNVVPTARPASGASAKGSPSSSSSSSKTASSSSISVASSAVNILRGWEPLSRSEVEQDLVFMGFLIFDCDMKPV